MARSNTTLNIAANAGLLTNVWSVPPAATVTSLAAAQRAERSRVFSAVQGSGPAAGGTLTVNCGMAV